MDSNRKGKISVPDAEGSEKCSRRLYLWVKILEGREGKGRGEVNFLNRNRYEKLSLPSSSVAGNRCLGEGEE